MSQLATGFAVNTIGSTIVTIAMPDSTVLAVTGPKSTALTQAWAAEQTNRYAPTIDSTPDEVTSFMVRQSTGNDLLLRPVTVNVPDHINVEDGPGLLDAFLEAALTGTPVSTYMSVRAACAAWQTTIIRSQRPVNPAAPVLENAFTLADGEVLTRPNGQTYIPRRLVGHTDAAALRRAREMDLYALLRGNPGTGKTAVADATFPDLVAFSCTGDTTVAHLVGSYVPNPDGTFRWENGPLTTAMLDGRAFLADEIDRLPHEVSAVLHSAMDGRRTIRLDDRPDAEPIIAAPGFYVIGTYNPNNLGGKPLPEAILSRFPLQIEVGTDYDSADSMGVPTKFVTLGRNLATRARAAIADGGLPVWAPEMRELLAAKRFIDAGFGEVFALASLIESCPVPEDVPTVREVAGQIFGVVPESMRLGEQV